MEIANSFFVRRGFAKDDTVESRVQGGPGWVPKPDMWAVLRHATFSTAEFQPVRCVPAFPRVCYWSKCRVTCSLIGRRPGGHETPVQEDACYC